MSGSFLALDLFAYSIFAELLLNSVLHYDVANNHRNTLNNKVDRLIVKPVLAGFSVGDNTYVMVRGGDRETVTAMSVPN